VIVPTSPCSVRGNRVGHCSGDHCPRIVNTTALDQSRVEFCPNADRPVFSVFNAFNPVNLGVPDIQRESSGFGQILKSGNAPIVQFELSSTSEVEVVFLKRRRPLTWHTPGRRMVSGVLFVKNPNRAV